MFAAPYRGGRDPKGINPRNIPQAILQVGKLDTPYDALLLSRHHSQIRNRACKEAGGLRGILRDGWRSCCI